jgi:hypothetical protein
MVVLKKKRFQVVKRKYFDSSTSPSANSPKRSRMSDQREPSTNRPVNHYSPTQTGPPKLPLGSGFCSYHVLPTLEGVPHIYIRTFRTEMQSRPVTATTVDSLWEDIHGYVNGRNPIKADRSGLYTCFENSEKGNDDLKELLKAPPLKHGWRNLPLRHFEMFFFGWVFVRGCKGAPVPVAHPR